MGQGSSADTEAVGSREHPITALFCHVFLVVALRKPPFGAFFFFFFPALFFLLASPLGIRNLGSLKNKKLRRLTASIAALLLQHCLPISAARSWAYPCTRAKTYKAPVLPALSRLLEKFHRLANFHPLVSPLPSSLYLLCKRPLHCAWPCWASRAATTFPGLSSLFPEPRPASPFS